MGFGMRMFQNLLSIRTYRSFHKSSIKEALPAELLGKVFSTIENQNELLRDFKAANDSLKIG